jgi:hypothetical protein
VRQQDLLDHPSNAVGFFQRMPGTVTVLTVKVPSLESGKKAPPAWVRANSEMTRASAPNAAIVFQRRTVACSIRR